jgi:hypothetical protein
MKNFLFYLLSIVLTGSLLTSCNEDIDLVGDFKETAVVYGLLDQADSIHIIKINRAFIGPGNSLEIAKVPDSSYFNQVEATVSEYINDANGNPTIFVRKWVLKDTLIPNKDANGVFYAPTQTVYYFATKRSLKNGNPNPGAASNENDLTASLNKDAIYKLHITLNGGELEVDGETELVSGISSSTIDPPTYRYDFIENDGSYASKGLLANTGNSYFMNGTLEISFDEINSGIDTTLKTFKWNLGESEVSPNGVKTFTLSGATFYNVIKSNCSNDAAINQRRMHSINGIITGGAEDFYTYMAINQPTSSLAQNKPTFTNLSVSEGFRVIGIFSSRFTYSVNKLYFNPANSSVRTLTVESVKELCNGAITGGLNFCSQHPADNGTAWACQ